MIRAIGGTRSKRVRKGQGEVGTRQEDLGTQEYSRMEKEDEVEGIGEGEDKTVNCCVKRRTLDTEVGTSPLYSYMRSFMDTH